MSTTKKALKEDGEKIKQRIRSMRPARLTFLSIMFIITVITLVFYEPLFSTDPEKNIFLNDETGKIDTGVLFFDQVISIIPTALKCIQSVTILLILATVIDLIINRACGKSSRGVTISGLLSNLLSWLTAIIFVIIVLSSFGVDTTALITGAGVLTLIVGLGMQSLIADIVAGLFIVFENDFNVGDYISVDGFRGQVLSIGVRTTKLNGVGNIKIINNSDLRGVINLDLEPTYIKTLVDIEYGAKLPEVEQIIREHESELCVPHAVDTPVYNGVANLGASGVTLQFSCHCREEDIFSASRELNGTVKNLFDNHGISIPFPQIVVHHE